MERQERTTTTTTTTLDGFRLNALFLVFAALLASGSGWHQGSVPNQLQSPGHRRAQQQRQQSSMQGDDAGAFNGAAPQTNWRTTKQSLLERQFQQASQYDQRQHIVPPPPNASSGHRHSSSRAAVGYPFIDSAASSGNVSVLVGKQLILSCVVRNLGNESVSWLRHRNSELLAVNSFVYSSSHRVKVFRDDGGSSSSRSSSPEWRLSLNPVLMEDAGLYECQVSTTPHASHFMAINVIEPRTSILGTRELFIEAGSTINLTCLIHTGGQAMRDGYIYWNYNGQIIHHDRHRGGTIVIDKRADDVLTSLIISHADIGDSGRYTCDPASAYAQTVAVHVARGSDAVMRHTIAAAPPSSSTPSLLLLLLILPAALLLVLQSTTRRPC